MTTSNLTERAASERALHNAHMVQADFNLAPFTIAWEVTRAPAPMPVSIAGPMRCTHLIQMN